MTTVNINDIKKAEKAQQMRIQKYSEMMEQIVREELDDIMARLIEKRKELNMTQQNIADLTGMKSPNIARMESRKMVPSLVTLKKYADAVGLEINVKIKNK